MNKQRKTLKLLLALAIALTFAMAACQSAEGADPEGTAPAGSDAPSISEAAQVSATTTPVGGSLPESSFFEAHFIDVGQADAILVLCDGRSMLIDGGNVADSNVIYTYLNKQNITDLDYIVCTHAHEDHVGGLSGALNLVKNVGVAFAPVTSYDSDAFNDFLKYLDNKNVPLTIPSAGDEFSLGSANVTILAPINSSSDTNDTSIVLRVVYGETSFLFTGDAGQNKEHDILDSGRELQSTVLKVGHHGSETSTSYSFLREVAPKYAVISVGANNSYGHPTEATLSRLRDADTKLYRTDMQGDIICKSDGKNVTFTVSRNANADTLAVVGSNSTASETPTPTAVPDPPETSAPASTSAPTSTPAPLPVTYDYILNTSSKKFHYPSCRYVDQMKESNKQSYNGTRDDLIAQGYSPCGHCNP